MKLKITTSLALTAALMAGASFTALGADTGRAFASYDHTAGPYSGSQHLDWETLAEAGVIGQTTAERIAAYGSGKHEAIHGRYAADMSGMTPDERHALYAGYEKDGFDGDSVDGLLHAGVITQEEADDINAYLGQQNSP